MHTTPITTPVDNRAIKYLSENRIRYRAQSILHGFVRDPLPSTVAEAEDIVRWHEQTAPKEKLS